jgi:two-component system sensor histidine kinase MtrB
MSLHRILSIFIVIVASLALGAAISLVLLTTYLHRTTVELETGLQSVRLAEEMQIDLLTYIRTSDEFLRTRVENDLRKKLHEARQYAGTPEETGLLTDSERLIEEHFEHIRQSGKQNEETSDLQLAFGYLRRLIDINVEQAENSMAESEQWDDVGDRIGMGFSALLVIGMASMLIWLGRVAFQPVFEIQRAMREFAAGRKDARAPERGPEELRMIARQFNDMASALARQYENQLSFLASVAHDLRNPIGTLKGSAEILSTEANLPSETISKLLSVIKRQVYGLDRMIGDLLDTSRIESGHLELRMRECDARPIAQNAFDLFHSGSKDHNFRFDAPEMPVQLRCDPLRIEQVLNNLISNAVKYSPPGSTVELSVQQIDGEVQFEVKDEGMGIPSADLPYVFEPFRRTTTSRKEEMPGVGLGLSVAQRIVRAHGGHILVESRVGQGTTFRVHLPALTPSAQRLTA